MSSKSIRFSFLLFAFLLSRCGTTGGGASSNAPHITDENVVKWGVVFRAQTAKGQVWLYDIFLSRRWCAERGTDVKDEFTPLTTPGLALDVDDEELTHLLNYALSMEFDRFPERREPNLEELKQLPPDKRMRILVLETPHLRKIVYEADVLNNFKQLQAFNLLFNTLVVQIGRRYPPLTVLIEQSPLRREPPQKK